ncbi:hypothetical protein [Nostoc sp.]
MLKICPYRQSRRSKLECTITEQQGKNFTSSTSVSICNECSIPEIIQQVNCKNLNLIKFHSGIQTQTFDAIPEEYVSESGWRTYCQVIGFNSSNDYKTKCSPNCPAFQPINRDLSSEELILIPNFNAAKATDRELRQAVLLILYKYHTRHPERYLSFDVTHEFIAKSLNISVPDVVRVIFPMEDEQEVVTERYLGEAYFRRVRITSRGIQMIDEELLFGRLNTAEVRVMGTLINMPNSQVSALCIGDNNQNQGEFMSEASKYDMRGSNFPGGFAENNYGNMVENQINYAIQQNLVEAATEIQQLLTQLQNQGLTIQEAQQQAAQDLAQKAQSDPTIKSKLLNWRQSLGDAAAKAIITEATKEVFKLALGLLGIPMP